ncbi:hypothetical protein [Viridibacillus arvi]|uniref:hypothetical protein n=1 Tax=Viridibacillus arvi TaxID=263475 RepID=UPI0034CFECDA
MNNAMYNKYKQINLTAPLIEMYTELIEKDEVTRKIFVYIGKKMAESIEPDTQTKIGATINNIAKDLVVNRNVRIRGSAKFKVAQAQLDRKHVERIIHSLLLTGLCYYEQVGKTKVIYCTDRGIQVLRNIYSKEIEATQSLQNM